MAFWDRLRASIAARNSLLCVGLDLSPERLPPGQASIADWGRALVAETAEYACAYKPNIAFFESGGPQGLAALREILDAIPSDIPVILDAKRADIAATAEAYARAAFDVWGADALTVNPYLGADGILPFASYRDRGLFILCKTSNPSAGELQDWSQDGIPLYQRVAELAHSWLGEAPVGLVVGATYPEAITEMRARWPGTWFLIPGVGAQGGELQAVLRAGLDEQGAGVLINASRSIVQASDPAAAARELRDAINAVRRDTVGQPRVSARERQVNALAQALYAAGCVRFGDYLLASGAHSPVYIDLRRLVTFPRLLDQVAAAYAQLLSGLTYDRLAAIPYAALPIGTAVALRTGDALIYPRKEAKAYGTRQAIEGDFRAGETVVLLDDLITTGGSKLQAAEPLLEAGLHIHDVVVLIDREQGGRPDLAQHGLQLHAALTLRELVTALEAGGQLSSDLADRVRAYLVAGAA